jgi:hypothetical protein
MKGSRTKLNIYKLEDSHANSQSSSHQTPKSILLALPQVILPVLVLILPEVRLALASVSFHPNRSFRPRWRWRWACRGIGTLSIGLSIVAELLKNLDNENIDCCCSQPVRKLAIH